MTSSQSAKLTEQNKLLIENILNNRREDFRLQCIEWLTTLTTRQSYTLTAELYPF